MTRLLLTSFVLVLVFAGASLWSPQDVLACSCEPPVDAETEYKRVDYVFSGEVTQITGPDSDNYLEINIDVSTSWKGVDHQAIGVGTPAYGDACGYNFSEGGEYLIYASENDARVGPEIITGVCSRTAPLYVADEDLLVLGTGTDTEALEEGTHQDGLDLWVLFGSIALFLAIVIAITLLRRLR